MRFLLLLVAAVVAIFAGVAALQLSGPAQPDIAVNIGQPSGAAGVLTVDVLVARQPIPPGAEITAAMLDKQPWPENLVLEGFISGPDAEKAVIGKVARSNFESREPIIATKLSDQDDAGFLAARLPAGMRAITISTDAITGVAGFVFPGDHVDILFTHNIPEKGSQGGGGPVFNIPGLGAVGGAAGGGGGAGYAEVLAANVPVLAINIRESSAIANAAAFIPGAENALGNIAGGGNTPSSMTLQVNDLQAEKIRLAERAGSISVALRSLRDRGSDAVPPPASLASLTRVDLSTGDIPQMQGEEVKVIRGGMSANTPPAGIPGLNFMNAVTR